MLLHSDKTTTVRSS